MKIKIKEKVKVEVKTKNKNKNESRVKKRMRNKNRTDKLCQKQCDIWKRKSCLAICCSILLIYTFLDERQNQ